MSSVELTVTVQDNKKVRAKKGEGTEQSAEVQWDSLRRDTIGIFEDWLSLGKISKRRELEVLGTHLYRTIFNGDVESLFEKTLDDVPRGERLRVQLSFQEEATDLAVLPWEYLYCPDTETRRGFFLATNVELVLSRYMPTDKDRERIELEEDERLRILIVVSDPQDKDLGPVVADPVVKAIKELETTHPIAIETLDKPTVDNLLDALNGIKPHVLHFIGHGRYSRTEEKSEIALLAEDGKSVRWCEDKDFAEYFIHTRSIPHVIFLHLCESATIKEEFRASFSELARHLMKAHIQAVVAMQYPITNEAAVAFSRAFYRGLAKGEPIDHAVQTGRWRITTKVPKSYDSRVFGTPVLYMHSRDGILLPAQRPSTTEEAGRRPGVAPKPPIAPHPSNAEIINDIRVAAYAEAGRKGLNEELVKKGVEGLISSRNPEEIRLELTRRIQQDPFHDLTPVWVAIASVLKKHSG